MGCNGCSTDESGLPKGCRSNGNCQTGSCNKLNTYDWLADMPIAFATRDKQFYEVSFKNGSRKGFFKASKDVIVDTGDLVIVESSMGYDIGEVTLSGELVKLQMRKKGVKETASDIRYITGKPDEKSIENLKEARSLEKSSLAKARSMAKAMKLNMKIGDIEFQADRKKATFYYTAEERVDFRELIKDYAQEFKIKVEMRQIGARQEAGKIGGIGDCGRELCCSTWLTEFKSVSTSAARYQSLSLNVEKLSGQCGRLKCCLNYELDNYMEATREFPKKADILKTNKGPAYLQKTDILKRLMWYSYEDSQKYYPLTVEKVKEILEMNKTGEKPEDIIELAVYDIPEIVEEKETDLVGHISLEALDKSSRKGGNKSRDKRRRNKGRNNNNKSGRRR